jgi:hypothetical protein
MIDRRLLGAIVREFSASSNGYSDAHEFGVTGGQVVG